MVYRKHPGVESSHGFPPMLSFNAIASAYIYCQNCIATFKRHLKPILFKAAYGVADN